MLTQSRESVRFWRCKDWIQVGIIDPSADTANTGMAIHPKESTLAILGHESSREALLLWDLNPAVLLSAVPPKEAFHYRNAKVVLVGDTGVGKSALALVLTGQTYANTDSTHGRNVWTLESQELELSNGQRETRETLLWDLAGQVGYRLTHQLHLNEVAVALIVFDAKSEVDPFAGVRHWAKALDQARDKQSGPTVPLSKILVQARSDRGGISVSNERTASLMEQYGICERRNTR